MVLERGSAFEVQFVLCADMSFPGVDGGRFGCVKGVPSLGAWHGVEEGGWAGKKGAAR